MTLLQLDRVSKSFQGLKVVDNVSFSIEAGSITSIIGPNGAGKTSLFNIINGYIRQDFGQICFKDKSLGKTGAWQRAFMGIGRLWQDLRLFRNMTVEENLLVSMTGSPDERLLNLIIRRRRIAEFHKEAVKKVVQVLAVLGLEEKRRSLAGDLSYGQQKLLAIGRLLMNESEILLLDEPATGISAVMLDRVFALIRDVVRQGRTVLMIEHNVPRALAVSDWVHVMDDGQIMISGQPEKVMSDPQLKEIYLGV